MVRAADIGNRRILWVDDNHSDHNRAHIEYLSDSGYEVELAETIRETLDLLRSGQAYDLVLLDVSLRSSDEDLALLPRAQFLQEGVALGRWIRKNRLDLKFAGLTMLVEDTASQTYFQQFSDGFILKQRVSRPRELLAFIDSIFKPKSFENVRSFIIHGHDDGAKLALKNYLENTLRLPQPKILHERPPVGDTLIEKLERETAGADLAFVLLTGDDPGTGALAPSGEKLRRPRQNVIFELGYFFGKMGRKSGRTIVLYKKHVEIPSDLQGLELISIENGIEAAGEAIRRAIEAAQRKEG